MQSYFYLMPFLILGCSTGETKVDDDSGDLVAADEAFGDVRNELGI